MKLLLLTASLVAVSNGFSATYTVCTGSTDCSGDTCTTTSYTYSSGCVDSGVTNVYYEYTCENNLFNTTTYNDSSCSTQTYVVSIPVGVCVEDAVGGSEKYECGDSAMQLSLIFVGVMVLIASLFQ